MSCDSGLRSRPFFECFLFEFLHLLVSHGFYDHFRAVLWPVPFGRILGLLSLPFFFHLLNLERDSRNY